MNNISNQLINCPVFVYHHIKPEDEYMMFSTTAKKLDRDIQTLLMKGYKSVSLKTIFESIQGKNELPEKSFCITFDDGYECNYHLGYPILKKYNVYGDIFISTDSVGAKTHPSIPDFIPHFSWEQALVMQNSGLIKIHSHGHCHEPNNEMPSDLFDENVRTSLALIQNHLGSTDIKAYAYPYSEFNAQTNEKLNDLGFGLLMIACWKNSKEFLKQGCIGRIEADFDIDIMDMVEAFKCLSKKSFEK